MKRSIKKKKKALYRLKGDVGWYISRNDGDDDFVGETLDEEFECSSDKKAIAKAREIVDKFLSENQKYSPINHQPDENEWPRTFQFTLEKVLWKMKYKEPESAIPARTAVPAKPERILEIIAP